PQHFRNAGFPERGGEGVALLLVLERIPERVNSLRKPLVCPDEASGEPLEFAILLEGRIDQDESALFLGRQLATQRQPAIELDYPALDIPGEQRRQRLGIRRVQFHREQPV